MSETTHCPYCNAKLRISKAHKRPNRVKCSVCRNYFHPSHVTPTDGARSLNEPLIASATDSVEPPDSNGDSPAIAVGDLPPPDPESIDAEVIKAAFPEEKRSRRPSRRKSSESPPDRRSHRGRMATTGGSKRRFELALAFGLMGLGGAGLIAAVWYFMRPAPAATERSVPLIPMDVSAPSAPLKSVLADDFAPKPLPPRLIGSWELRSDDDRRGWIDFRADGTVRMTAWRADREQSPFSGFWFLIEDTDDQLVIELGAQHRQLGNPRYYLNWTGPDAFTLTHVLENGLRMRQDLRYARKTAPAAPRPNPARSATVASP